MRKTIYGHNYEHRYSAGKNMVLRINSYTTNTVHVTLKINMTLSL